MGKYSYTWSYGGIVRGPREEKRLSLIFTGGEYGEGFKDVLDQLAEKNVKGGFFFTGAFLEQDALRPLVQRAVREGHYIGPHSHAHLLYCPWEDRSITLVHCEEFKDDLEMNLEELAVFGRTKEEMRFWIPPYEWYNDQISAWSREMGMRLFNFTPGTLSHADYTTEDMKNYRSSDVIWKSIFDYESTKEDGLNGWIMLIHVGAGEKRRDKFYARLGALIEELRGRGYDFARIDDLLAGAPLVEPGDKP